MTISYSSTEAAAGPDIKRQSTNVAETSSWVQSGEGGGWDCEKVNNWRATRRLPHIVNRSRESQIYIQTDGIEEGTVTASSLWFVGSLPVNVPVAPRGPSLTDSTLAPLQPEAAVCLLNPLEELQHEGRDGERRKDKVGEKIKFNF